MGDQTTSFSFRADGTRAPLGSEPLPHHFGYGALAKLYATFKETDYLSGVLVRMTNLDHSTLCLDPKKFILRGDKHEVEVKEPYNDFYDGPRVVLTDTENHIEWKKRKRNNYKTRDELVSTEELLLYARTGNMPRQDLGVSSLVPTPVRVVFWHESSGDTDCPRNNLPTALPKIIQAHRAYKMQIQAVITTETSKRYFGGSQWKRGSCNTRDDVHGVRGCLEETLRLRVKLEDNTTKLNSCAYEVRKQAYEANRKAILECIGKIKCRKVQDANQGWSQKVKWASAFQSANGGISLNPPKTAASRKKRKVQIEGVKYEKLRRGAARASMKDLRMPQIAWGPSIPDRDFDVLVVGGNKFMNWKKNICTFSWRVKVIVLVEKECEWPDTLSMKSYMALVGDVRVITNELEKNHLHLLIQWLPLWWDYPKHLAPMKANPMPNLKRRLQNFLRTVRFGGDEDSDALPLWISQLKDGANDVPLFATACGWKDCKERQIVC